MTQEQLAEGTGLPHSTISEYERGERDVYIGHLYRFAEAMDIRVEEILQETEAAAQKLHDGIRQSGSMRLYKYCGPERLQVLENASIRFSQPHVFNDPFEMLPHIEGVIERQSFMDLLNNPDHQDVGVNTFLEKMKESPIFAALPDETLKRGFEQSSPSMKGVLSDLMDVLSHAMSPTFGKGLREGFNKNVGVLCLCESYTDLLMWGHYGNCHTGFAIEFNPYHAFFHQRKSDNDELRELRKVIYTEKRPSLYLNRLNYTDLCLTKSAEWKYEREWRMVVSLEDSDRKIGEGEDAIHLFNFPRQCITGIILGCKSTPELKQKIFDILDAHPEHWETSVRRAEMDKDKFGLSFHPVPRITPEAILEAINARFPETTPYPNDRIDALILALHSLGIVSMKGFVDTLETYTSHVEKAYQDDVELHPPQFSQEELINDILWMEFIGAWDVQYRHFLDLRDSPSEEEQFAESMRNPPIDPQKAKEALASLIPMLSEAFGISEDQLGSHPVLGTPILPPSNSEPTNEDESEVDENDGAVQGEEVSEEVSRRMWWLGAYSLYHAIPQPSDDDYGRYFPIPRPIGGCPLCGHAIEARIVEERDAYNVILAFRCTRNHIYPHNYDDPAWHDEESMELDEIVNHYWLLKKHQLPIRKLNEEEQGRFDELCKEMKEARRGEDKDPNPDLD